jgi:hypothetical protein
MPMSLADLRLNAPKSRPERSVTLCLAPHLVAEVQIITSKMAEIPSPGAAGQRPRRSADGEDPRAAELRERLEQLLEEMAEHEGEMRLRANRSDGEWRIWCNEHPAREEGEPGHERDQRVASGFCNADDLIDDLGTYAAEWDGDPLTGNDWADIFEPNIASADKAAMAQSVVAMYESRLDFPQWRSSLSANLQRLNDLTSPSDSESPTSDSTDGNPEPSSEATTETDSESPLPTRGRSSASPSRSGTTKNAAASSR